MLTSGQELQFVGSRSDVFGPTQLEMKVSCGERKKRWEAEWPAAQRQPVPNG